MVVFSYKQGIAVRDVRAASRLVGFCRPPVTLGSSRFLPRCARVCDCPSRSRVVAYAKAGGGKKPGKGFGSVPQPKPSSKPVSGEKRLQPPVDSRPLVDSSEEFVPRGPTMRQQYADRGLIEEDYSPDAGVLPQVVADRMIRRIAGFAGVPLATLFLFFGAYFVAKYKYDITVLPALVAYTTLGCIGTSGIGITYGIMSSSWDEEEEGTKLGWKELRMNFVRAKDGLTGMLAKERRQDMTPIDSDMGKPKVLPDEQVERSEK